MGNVTMPTRKTLSPVNPTSDASIGCSLSLSSFICWYVGRYNMSAELPLSTITSLVVKPAIFMVMTRASSCSRWVPLASSSLKEIIWSSKRIFLGGRWMTRMLCTYRAYAFLEARDVPPDAGPPMMVLISPIGPGLWFSICSYNPRAFDGWVFDERLTYFCNLPCRMSVSTCSFNSM